MLAEKYELAYVDLYSPLLNPDSGEIYAEYTTDGGHLTHKGYEVLTESISPILEEELFLWTSEG
jgi:lysophospholipase L1-like esterase